jgi:protein-tyrosine phosphatase
LPGIYEGLWVGSCKAAKDLAWLNEVGITYVINITARGQVRNYFEGKLKYLRLPCEDLIDAKLSEFFPEAFKFLDEAVQTKSKVLVHCRAGRSRSCAICIGFGMHREIPLLEAHEAVKTQRTNMQINTGFQIQLMKSELELLKVEKNSLNFFPGRKCKRKRENKWDFSARGSIYYSMD